MDTRLIKICKKLHPERIAETSLSGIKEEIRSLPSSTIRNMVLALVHGQKTNNKINSELLYCLGITDDPPVGPLKRIGGSLPDIDIDIEKRFRDRVIEYVMEKYGHDRVAHIGTFNMMRAKAAVRSVCRTLGHPYAIGDELSKLLLPPIHGKPQPLEASIQKVAEIHSYMNNGGTHAEILKWAMKVEDLISSLGVHASGIVISNSPLAETVPLFLGKGGELATQWEMNNIEEVGLIKFDFLGLDALTKVHRCIDIVKKTRDIEVDIDNIDIDDEEVFTKLRAGDNVGIFQLEASSGMKDLLVQIRPTSVEDLIALVAIYRPGPLCLSGDTQILTNIYSGKGKTEYRYETLESLYETYQSKLISKRRPRSIKSIDEQTLLLKSNQIKKIHKSGVKEVYRIDIQAQLTNDYSVSKKKPMRRTNQIKATAEHKFLTLRGWKALYQLYPGDYLAINYRGHFGANKIRSVYGRKNFRNIAFRHYEYKCVFCNWSGGSLDVHHIEGNRNTDNSPENLCFLCPNHHREYTEGYINKQWLIQKREERKLPITPDIMFVRYLGKEYIGEEETYDIEMESPYNNFIAGDFVVHNSSDYKNVYLDVRAGRREPEYLVPELEPILSRTSGWLIYQEQCCAEDSSIWTDTGAKKIQDIVIGDRVRVTSEYDKVIDVACTGHKECINIQSSSGNIVCTPDHKILSYDSKTKDDKFVYAETLSKDSLIRKASPTTGWSWEQDCTNLDEIEEAYRIGILLGDGCVTKTCTIATGTKDFADFLEAKFAPWGDIHKYFHTRSWYVNVKQEGGRGPPVKKGEFRSSVTRKLHEYGLLGENCKTKQFPPFVKQHPLLLAACLCGLIDTDGSILPGQPWHITTTSAQLRDDIAWALDILNAQPIIRESRVYLSDLNSLRIAGLTTYKEFPKENRQTEGYVYKRDQVNELLLEYKKENESIKTLCKRLDYSYDKFNSKIPWIRVSSIPRLLRVKLLLRDAPVYSYVKSVRNAGIRKVYDITTETSHEFNVQGHIVHNCMEIAKCLCGYTGGEADELRKAVGKKKKALMDKHEPKFKEGWQKHGLSEETARQLWDDMVGFSAYAFNRTVDKDTKVVTIDGIKRIEDCSSSDTVYTIDLNGNVVESDVLALHDHGIVPLWEVEFDDGTIEKCTLDHKWLTEWGQQPLWRILDLDCEVWGSATYEEASCIPSAKMQQVSEPYQKWYQQHNSEDFPVWYENKDTARRGQETQTELQRLQDQEKTNTPTDKNQEQQNSRGSQDNIRNSKENLCKTRDSSSESSGSGPMEEEKSREALRDMEEGLCQSQEIQDGSMVRTSPYKAWIHTEHQNPMWTGTKTGGFYQQRAPGNPRGRWTMALLSGSWRRSTTKNPDQGSDVRHRDITKRVAASPDLYGELQVLRRTYEDKLRGPLWHTGRPKSPTYSMHRKVVRVSYVGMQQGYDLEVDHPEHNFLLSSGLCCSNSHAAAYAMITYQTAWLKTHFPVEFMCAVMISEGGNKDDMIKCLAECKRLGIEVKPPNINKSWDSFFVDDGGSIRFGLGPVKNLGESPVQLVIQERNVNGPFKSLKDFCERIDLGVVNRLKLESLIKAGAFDGFGENRASLLAAIEPIWEYRKQTKAFEKKLETYHRKIQDCEQRLIDITEGKISDAGKVLKPLKEPERPEPPVYPELIAIEEMPIEELLVYEHNLLGFYVSAHPLDDLADTNYATFFNVIEDAKKMSTKTDVSIAVVITNKNEITTRKKKKMAFLSLEDLTGSIEAVCFPNVYDKFRVILDETRPVRIDATVEVTEADEERVAKLVIRNISLLDMTTQQTPRRINVSIDAMRARDLIDTLNKYVGDQHEVRVSLKLQDGTEIRLNQSLKIGPYKGAFERDIVRINDGKENT